jgi:arylsulfatase A
MNFGQRNSFPLRVWTWFGGAIALIGLVGMCGSDTLADDSKPLNVVFILADDLGWGEVGCYGQEKIPTPNLDALARQGMRFTQHYSGAPVCAPSRCVLMTGRHLGHAEVRGNLQARTNFPQFTEGQHPLTVDAVTIAQVFQRAGYRTGAMGKWGLGPVGSTGAPDQKGFDLFFGYNCQAIAHSYYPRYLWRNDQQVFINDPPVPGHRKQPDGEVQLQATLGQQYAPDLMIEEAVRFIEGRSHDPFFLYLPFIEPHVAIHPPADRLDRFPAEWDERPYRGEAGYLPHPRPRAGYAAMIHDLDRYVGRVVETLEKAGLADNTLVVFTSDNGSTHEGNRQTTFHIGGADPPFFNSTRGLRGYKGSVYEGGLRVPLIVRCPGRVPAGTVNEFPCYFADWFPTLVEAAGLSLPTGGPNELGLDGESLWPTLQDPNHKSETRRPMVWVFPEYGGQVATRFGDWKVVRRQLARPKPGEWELYNVATDPGETRDLASEHPDLVEQGIAILRSQSGPNEFFPVEF